MDNIRIIFVLAAKYSDEYEAAEIMLQAFENCKQNLSTNVSWVKEAEFKSLELNKTDFVVFEDFEGNNFETLKSSKCARILGPWVVSVCLMEGKSIPNFPWPIYNVAMYNCIITSSFLSKNLKLEIKAKVELMGGCYVDTLVAKNTHLVTGSAISKKYLAAAEAGVKLMCPSWIDDVWNSSQTVNIHADDKQFFKHKCLCFQNLTICSTGLSNVAERQKIEKLVKENGGTFSGKLNLANTNVLVCCGKVGLNSDKYKAARQKPNINCVTMDWILDSVHKGYALPHDNYQVQRITSTPTKEAVNPEFSILSAIGGPNMSQRSLIDDTISYPFSPRKEPSLSSAKNDYGELVENLDIKKAKKAGQYLDGCSVYITGFGADHTDKLNRVLNLSGATRYDTFSDRVTHVIVGDPSGEAKLLRAKNPSGMMVSVRWLVDSIERRKPAAEDAYLVDVGAVASAGSPLSRRGLSLLRSSRTVTEQEMSLVVGGEGEGMKVEEEEEECIVRRYLEAANTEEDTLAKLLDGAGTNISEEVQKPADSTLLVRTADTTVQQATLSGTQEETVNDRIFENKKFVLVGFKNEEYQELKERIEECCGELVPKSFRGIPDYAVVPIFHSAPVRHTAAEVVNDLFVSECVMEEALIGDIEYYHRPLALPGTRPLEGCVITISSYSGMERVFLRCLIEALGGAPQEQFARVRNEAMQVVASTHLVSADASGKKYEAGLKWGLPVVSKDWLLGCAETGKRAYEGDFLIGDAKAPEKSPEFSVAELSLTKTPVGAVKSTTPSTTPGPSRVLTPVNRVTPALKRVFDSAEKPFSQVTPLNKIMKNFRESKSIREPAAATDNKGQCDFPQPWRNIKTPETPLGRCLTPNPSASLKKQLEYWLQQFPDKPATTSNSSTPISEIKQRIWDNALKRCNDYLSFDSPNVSQSQQGDENKESQNSVNMESEDHNTEPPSHILDVTPESQNFASRLQQLEEMLTASGSGKRHSRNFQSTIPVPAGTSEFKDSQPCTVGWDFREEQEVPRRQNKMFALSGIAENQVRTRMIQHLDSLRAVYSNLRNYDPSCTHLLCPKPARNEKSLAFMAAGKWILHTSYLEKSVEAGHFLNEQDYEFGNPQSLGRFEVPRDADSETKMQMMYWWRKEISKRGYGAFNDMRAIVVANRREQIVRVIEAGGGVVIDVKPPFDDTVHATHCLLEHKSLENISDYVPLARQGVYLVNTVYISDFLYQPNRDIRDWILPYFSKYYARS